MLDREQEAPGEPRADVTFHPGCSSVSSDPVLCPMARRALRERGMGSEKVGEARRPGEGRSPDKEEGKKAGRKKMWEEGRERGMKGRKERRWGRGVNDRERRGGGREQGRTGGREGGK